MTRRLAITLLACLCAPGTSTGQDLPRPDLEPFEPVVRSTFEAQLEATESALRSGNSGESAAALTALAELYLVHGLAAYSSPALRRGLELEPGSVKIRYLLGHAAAESGDFAAAAMHFRELSHQAPDVAAVHYRLGGALFRMGSLAESRAALSRALELDAGCAAARARLGLIALREGDASLAIEHLEAALESQPQASGIRHSLAAAYRRAGQPEKAVAALADPGSAQPTCSEPLLAALPERTAGARLHAQRGTAALLRGELDLGLAELRAAVEIDPGDAEVRLGLGGALLLSDRAAEAIEELERGLALDADNAEGTFNLGTALVKAGRIEEGVTTLRRAAALDPGNGKSRLNLAHAQRRLGQCEPALEAYAAARVLAPDEVGAWQGAAVCAMRLERWRLAADLVQEARGAYPDDVVVAQLAARLWAAAPVEGLRSSHGAFELASRLLRHESRIDHVVTFAMALAAVGEMRRAAEWQAAALEAASLADEPELAREIESVLIEYRSGRPCRSPLAGWLADAPHRSSLPAAY